jgi:hypothetical protein
VTWTAYVDESMRLGPGVYLLAAACLDNAELVDARSAVAQLGRPTRRFHAQPLDEPLLWVPDIVAGAIGGELDLNERYAEQLAALVTRFDIELR